jgi:hypothetical protein
MIRTHVGRVKNMNTVPNKGVDLSLFYVAQIGSATRPTSCPVGTAISFYGGKRSGCR